MNSIDNRIVELEFDNKQFESGVQTSIKSIDALKKGLNFEGAAKGLSNLDRAGRAFSLAGMAENIDFIANKFTALGIAGVTALANITNSVVNAGVQLVKSFTIDPITTGLQEYETKIGAIQTILTNTKSKGTTLEDVNKILNELNKYADLTIYNFAEMTRSIGMFTAAGVGLEDSAIAIKGIANLAAGSGSDAMKMQMAMYQLSQALAAGRVQLIDWNSVVNANMGGELFQNALRETAKELGIVVNAAKPFRETLQDGWLTSEVLLKTLAKFANDPDLILAATQITKFSQLLTVMKESLQSGWAQTWEEILGNKDEAAAFFTSINDGFSAVVGSASEARNKMLAYWKANGGRADLIKSLSNVLIGLSDILKPIEEAFRDIFPPMTGQRLVQLTKALKELTEKFKIGDETAQNIKNTFKGLFALLDIGRMAITAIVRGLATLLGVVLPVGDGLLYFTGGIGNFVVAVDKALKSSKAFTLVVNALVSVIKPVANGIKNLAEMIVNAFKTIGSPDLSGLDSLSEDIQKRFSPLEKLAQFLQNVFKGFFELAGAFGHLFGEIKNAIINSFNSANFNTVFDVINSSLFAGILYGIKRFIDSATNILDDRGFLDRITGILDGVKGSLQSFQNSLNAQTLIRIAISMGILAASLLTISLIDSKKLTASLAAMATMFVELFGSMAAFQMLAGKGGLIALIQITAAMLGFSTAILVLSFALSKIASIDLGKIVNGLIGIAGLAGILIGASKLLSASSKGLISGSVGFIIFGAAILVLVSAVERLSKLDPKKLANGLVGVAALMAGLVLFMKKADFSGLGVMKAAGLLVLAAGINVLANAVKQFSSINPGALVKGLIGVAVVLTELTIFASLTGNAKSVLTTAFSLTVLGGALYVLAAAVTKMGSMPWSNVARGLTVLGGSLAFITLAVNFLPTKGMFLNSLAMLDMASSIGMLANALLKMGGMPWANVAKGLILLAGSLSLITATFMFLRNGIVDATALLITTAALNALALALGSLGAMSIVQIGGALLALAGTFAVIGVAATFLTPIIPAILALSAAITILGIGIAAIGGGILALSAGLAGLAVAGTAGVVSLVALVSGLVGLIPAAMQIVAQGIINFAQTLGQGAVVIGNAFKQIVVSIINVIVTIAPNVANAFVKLLTRVLQTIAKFTPQIVTAGMHIILGFLKGISSHIKEVTQAAVDTVVNFVNGIASRMDDIVNAGFNLMVAFINGLSKAITRNSDVVLKAIANLVLSILKAIGNGLKLLVTSFYDIGKQMIQGMINGIKEKFVDILITIGGLTLSVIEKAKETLGVRSPSKIFAEIGQNLGAGLTKGIEKSTGATVDASEKMSKDVVKASSGVVKASNEASKKAFDAAVEWINDRKYYNKLSLNEELDAWKRIQKAYIEGTEERKKADKEVYRVEQEIHKKAFDDSMAWIEERKYYNQLGLNAELEAYQRVQKQYLEGTEERKKADRDVYRVKKELSKVDEEYSKSVIDLAKSANAAKIQLEQDYYDKVKQINDQLKSDIQSVTDEYENAIKARTDALYQAYGLFDKVDAETPVSGQELITNLEDQVKQFETWQENLNDLSSRGVDATLITELQNMGPKSLAQIKALNSLSQPELDKYVSLWKTKSEEARAQATNELEGLRVETLNKINELNLQATIELEAYRATWSTEMETLSKDTNDQLEKLKKDWLKQVGDLKTTSEQEFLKLTNNIQQIVTSSNWRGTGQNVVDGIIIGMQSKVSELAQAAAEMAATALAAANTELGIESPSKEFAKVGRYSVEGFVVGLKSYTSDAVSSAKDVGTSVISTLRDAVANLSDSVNGEIDVTPVIRPVIDLTNIKNGSLLIGEMLSGDKGINLSAVNVKLPTVSKGSPATATDTNKVTQEKPISFTQNNYSPTALSRLDIYRQTRNQIATMKGLVSG